jgi:hypothetical protein
MFLGTVFSLMFILRLRSPDGDLSLLFALIHDEVERIRMLVIGVVMPARHFLPCILVE